MGGVPRATFIPQHIWALPRVALSNVTQLPLQHQEQRLRQVAHALVRLGMKPCGLWVFSSMPCCCAQLRSTQLLTVQQEEVMLSRSLATVITSFAPPGSHMLSPLMPHFTHEEVQIEHSTKKHLSISKLHPSYWHLLVNLVKFMSAKCKCQKYPHAISFNKKAMS